MPHRTAIKNAQAFLACYESQHSENFTNHWLVLSYLKNYGILSEDFDIHSFISKYKSKLDAIPLPSRMNNDEDDLSDFLSEYKQILSQFNLPLKGISSISKNVFDDLLKKLSRLQKSDALDMMAELLFFELGLKDGREASSNRRIYKFDLDHDPDKVSWPHNKMSSKYSLYAFKGPYENGFKIDNTEFQPEDFYYTLGTRLFSPSLVIALGEIGKDFRDYFSTSSATDVYNNGYMKITLSPNYQSPIDPTSSSQKNNKPSEKIKRYPLEIEAKSLQEEEISHIQKTDVLHISTPDGHAIDLPEHEMFFLTQEIVQKLKDGGSVIIHCKAGLGRTGQLVIESLLALDNNFMKLFASEDRMQTAKNIQNFVNELREIRPGLVLVKTQLLKALRNALQYQKKLVNHPTATNISASKEGSHFSLFGTPACQPTSCPHSSSPRNSSP